jgi:hypothetical protein
MIYSEKAFRLCDPSQKGLSEEWPQRHRYTGPSLEMIAPSGPEILNGPLTFKGPPSITSKRVFSLSIYSVLVSEINFPVCPIAVRHVPG